MRAILKPKPAVAADMPALQALGTRAPQLFRSVGLDLVADGPVRNADKRARTQRDGGALVAEKGETPAGFAPFLPLDGVTHLCEFSGVPAFQRMGVGRNLVAAVEDISFAFAPRIAMRKQIEP